MPQGSVLGPTLFLIYINDITNGVDSQIRLFADDTILYREISDSADTAALQSDLYRLECWEKKWLLAFNVCKCVQLTISKKRTLTHCDYRLHGALLKKVDEAIYLGLRLNGKLHWGAHINAIVAKANKVGAFVLRNLGRCPRTVQVKCYKSLVRPILEYAAVVWHPHQKFLTDKIEMVQRRVARRILRDFSRDTSVSSLVESLGLSPLCVRRVAARVTLLFKLLKGIVDVTPKEGIIVPAKRVGRGHGMKFEVPLSRVDVHMYSFFPDVLRLWNRLPREMIACETVVAFASMMEDHLIVSN